MIRRSTLPTALFTLALATGSVFAQTAPKPPAAAEPAIGPADKATEVSINTALAWTPVVGAKGYDVYFGRGAVGEKVPYQFFVTHPRFILETLSANTTYHWRVDAVMEGEQSKAEEMRERAENEKKTDAEKKANAATAKPAVKKPQAGPLMSFTTIAKPDRNAMFAWSVRMADTIHRLYPQPANLRGWNYTEGMMMDALYAIGTRTGRDKDIDYTRAWLDGFVSADGVIDANQLQFDLHSLDRVRPAPTLLWMYDRTKEEKYLKAAKQIASMLDSQPKTSDGGYFHRSTYKNQMWLDGIYMADVFSVEYAAKTKQPQYFDEAIKQVMLIHKHTFDPKSGLYYHGWDETKTQPWANKETGASPEFWGRAIGWYGMAMADMLDWLPVNHPGRNEILPIYQSLCAALPKFQDPKTGMWWQIVDKPKGPKNYVETSCTIMYAYAMAKGAQRGWLPPEYLENARRATRGVLNNKFDLYADNTVDIRDTVSVGSLGGNGGFYDYYVNVNLAVNDPKSLGAFMYLTMALSETANDTGPAAKEFPKRNP